MFKPFYIHGFNEPGNVSSRFARGFTLYVKPDEENERYVLVQGAWCSPKDQFVKKMGRSQALMADQEHINKRELPDFVNKCYDACNLESKVWDHNYLLKYVI